MSKINKIRIVNLNYNDNNCKINDELFYLNNENTLFNLRNGGGKSVLVQMITAPFVRSKYRKTLERPFESYFTTKVPTYILVEWELEHGAGYFLTGMMVKKKDVSLDENSKEKLDIVNFTHEYREENDFDIENLKVVEVDEKSKRVKSFSNTKKLFEDLRKDRSVKFNYYDMTNSKTSRDYFNKLLEYGIDHKEWEGIIKKINVKESGLSELFKDAKDVTGLIKKWFIPNIENKLDKDDSRIRNYRILIESYIKQYKENKANIDKKEKIEIFSNISKELFELAQNGIINFSEKERLEGLIKSTLLKLEEVVEIREKLEVNIEERKEELNEEIEELKYEKISIEIHKNKSEEKNLKDELLKINEDIKNNKEKLIESLRKKNILECAKIHKIYTEKSKEVQAIENKLQVIRAKSELSKDQITNLGYTLRSITKEELNKLEEESLNLKGREFKLEKEKSEIEEALIKDRNYLRDLEGKKGEYRGNVISFDTREERINNKFGLNIIRNIEGVLEEEYLLSVDDGIRNAEIELDKRKRLNREEIINLEKDEKEKINEREKARENITRIDVNLRNKKDSFKELNIELEERKGILKFIDFSKKRIFEGEEIKKEFIKKLEEFRESIREFSDRKDKIEREVGKLKTGNIIDVPKEVLNRLKEKDIKIIYGLEWLKKNGNNEEDNIRIVEKNPFIPYSLIMEKREIELLKEDEFDFFTSNPISIIDREELKQGIKEDKRKVIELTGVKFLIAFNNELLNEKQLLEIIKRKEEEIKELELRINEKKSVIEIYDEKLTKIKISKLTLELYKGIEKEINFLELEEKELKEKNLYLKKEISRIEDEIKDRQKEILKLDKDKDINEKKKEAFNEFKEEYKIYKVNKESLIETEEKIKIINDEIKRNEGKLKEVSKSLRELLREINKYDNLREEKEREHFKYITYENGEKIEKDKEDLEARFVALTVDITSSEKELMEEKAKKSQEFLEYERDLIDLANEHKIEEKEYINEAYNKVKEKEIVKSIRELEKGEKSLNTQSHDVDKNIAIKETEIRNLYKKLNEECNKEEIKEKRILIEKNFKEEIGKINIIIKGLEKEKKEVRKEREKLNVALASLSEYKDLKLKERVNVDIDINTICDETGILKRDLNVIKGKINKNAIKLKDKMIEIEISKEFKDELFFKDAIETLKKLNEKPKIFKEQLKNTLEAYKSIVEKLKADIEFIEKEEEKIISNLLEYIEEIHLNIGKIDSNSAIEIRGKKIKMLNIQISNFEEEREHYKIRLKSYIESIRESSLIALKKNENIEDIISSNITTIKLYDEVIGIGTIDIKLYKIEEDRQRKISWQEVAKNSGGEGFLSAFVILSSLLSYIRRDESDVFTKNEEGKVLIMDNPFAQTNAAHLLKPLMDIAKKSNTQLICLTGLNGESIYNRFDNIYVLNLVASRFKEGTKTLKKEHVKGTENHSEITAARFKLEDQIKLF